MRTAFTTAGASVSDVVCVPDSPPPASGLPGRLGRLPRPVRAPFTLAYRAARKVRRSLRRRGTARRALTPQLAGADLVIAESPEVARVALASGATPRAVWVLAAPRTRLVSDSGGLASDLARLAPQVGGFLTDSELARESVERATAAVRPRVEIFPPLATDRACPECEDRADATRDGLAAPVATLAEWRALLRSARAGEGEASAHGYAQARVPGATWEPAARRSDWSFSADADMRLRLEAPVAWQAAVQDRAASALLADVTPVAPSTPRPSVKVLLSGYDLKFAFELADRLDRRTDIEMMVDEWPALGRCSARTPEWLARADAVFAEWARTSAVWMSKRKRPGQFLVVRLHRFELDAPYPRDIAIENVDAVVYIAPLFGRRIRDELGWPVEKLVYIPNYIDLDWLDRPKLPEARFTIGFVGIEWARKRFDLALDLLAAVRREDPRFTLAVRSVMPWENRFARTDPTEREYVSWCFSRIEQDPLLRGGVIFDPPGRDMARWFRKVGHILSTSDEEGCHTAVGEGMGSGAVPLVRPWPGAAEVYDKRWVYESLDQAVAAVLACADEDVWAARAADAKAEIRRTYDPRLVVEAWADLLHGDVTGARRHFAEFAGMDGHECR